MPSMLIDTRRRTAERNRCEVLVRGAWTCVTIDQALVLRPERLKRCPECLGQVHALRHEGTSHPQARFEHLRPHKGCSRDGAFAGVSSRHPKALL